MFVYLISRIDPSSHMHNEAISAMISHNGHDVFIPHQNNPCDVAHDQLPLGVFEMDVAAMQKSDIGCVAFPIRCDCSAEIGWYSGNNKPVVGIIADTGHGYSTCGEQYSSIKNNWMVKGFLTRLIVIACHDTYQECLADPILKDKTVFLPTSA